MKIQKSQPLTSVVMKKECKNCFDQYKKDIYGHFCSTRCEEMFLEHAPVELIHKLYKEENGK